MVSYRHLWTAEEDALLTKLWADDVSSRDIGKALNMTKNAVIGRAHRLGFPKKGNGGGSHAPKTGRVRSILPRIRTRKEKAMQKKGSLGIAAPVRRTVEATKLKGSQPPRAVFASTFVDSAATRVSIVDVTPMQCHAIVDMAAADDRAYMCGRPAAYAGCPWCDEHRAIYTMPYKRAA